MPIIPRLLFISLFFGVVYSVLWSFLVLWFGLMVSIIRSSVFLLIWLSGFGLMDPPLKILFFHNVIVRQVEKNILHFWQSNDPKNRRPGVPREKNGLVLFRHFALTIQQAKERKILPAGCAFYGKQGQSRPPFHFGMTMLGQTSSFAMERTPSSWDAKFYLWKKVF